MPVQVITHTIKSSGGDYTTVSAWEAAQQRDLTSGSAVSGTLTGTDGQIEKAECYEMNLSNSSDILGWTTTASNYLWLTTPTDQRHGGITLAPTSTGAGFYMHSNTSTLRVGSTDWGIIDGLYIDCTATANGSQQCALSVISSTATAGGKWIVKNNLLVTRNSSSNNSFNQPLFRGEIVNNIVITGAGGSLSNGINVATATRVLLLNNTVLKNSDATASSAWGIGFGAYTQVWNNYVGGFSTDFRNGGTSSASGFGYNASKDTTATARFGTTSLSNMLPTEQFVVGVAPLGATTINLHLSASSGLIDAGSSTTTATLDIDGDSRS